MFVFHNAYFLGPTVYMALDVIPTDGTSLTWTVVNGDSSPTISSNEGKFGKSIYFDGSRQRVDLGSGSKCVNLIHVFSYFGFEIRLIRLIS